jgi:CRP-like cAMP-binding protein
MIFKSKARFDQLDQYLAHREYTLALEAITEEIKRRPDSFNLLLRQAEILGLAGDREQAIEVYHQLAQHYVKEGFYARAIAVNNKILRLDPQRVQVTEELASLIAAQQQTDQEARRRLREASLAPSGAPDEGGAAATVPASSVGAAQPPAVAPTEQDEEEIVVLEEEASLPPEAPSGPAHGPEDIPPEQARRERDAGRFFAAFPRPALEELLSSTEVISYEENQVIVNEGDPGTSMFLIVEGHVEVSTRDTAGRPLALARLGPGEFFGEVAMLTGRPRTATVVAVDRVTVIETSKVEIDRLVVSYPEVAAVMQHFLETRAQATMEKMLSRMREGNA